MLQDLHWGAFDHASDGHQLQLKGLLYYAHIFIGVPIPMLNIQSEEYEADNVTITVTVVWAQQTAVHVRYSASVVPWAPLMPNGSASYQLTILYNTDYNFSVVATTPCRPNATMFIILNYGEDILHHMYSHMTTAIIHNVILVMPHHV